LGSHLGEGMDSGLQRILKSINEAFSSDSSSVMLLLENTAGTKNSMGSSFEDIKSIIEGVEEKDRIGICFDTCHAFAAGYELRTDEGLRETLKALDDAVGIGRVKLIHLNDSKGTLNSHLDRHEHIGLGYIGEEGFENILSHPLFRKLPLVLETPVDERRDDVENIKKVRELSAK
ncbi:MAG: deoxyribonuclease IV, partial [Halobacteriota archaeon]|nr:deoxyribonuclease IV [Halobacteriota archaeon]